ncbi:MAG: hypothetical protein IJU23_05535 [Proteobacteria bacterium]|nr:hypothetical protein [Pseudomonadota bacterium]
MDKMGVFDNFPHFSYKKVCAPWEAGDLNDEQVSPNNPLSDPEVDTKMIRQQLIKYQLLGKPLVYLGFLGGVVGLCILLLAFYSKVLNSDAAESLMETTSNSVALNIFIGIVIIIISMVLVTRGTKNNDKKLELFKNQVVGYTLSKFFLIRKYIFKTHSVYSLKVSPLMELKIKDNNWNQIQLNDCFTGEYHSLPFVFLDCKLKKVIYYRKSADITLMFPGQIMIFKLNQFFNCSCKFYFTQDGLNIRPVESKMAIFDNLFANKISVEEYFLPNVPTESVDDYERFITRQYQMLVDSHSDAIPDFDEQAVAAARQYLMPKISELVRIVQIAQCDVGWILSGSYLAIILENSFDPFEYSYSDILRSDYKIGDRISRQVEWLSAILDAHVQAGLFE